MTHALPALALGTVLLTACASAPTVSSMPVDARAHPLQSIHVVLLPADRRGMGETIRTELEALGYQATLGPADQAPATVDASLSYRDEWWWDMAPYLMRLSLEVRDRRSGMLLGDAEVYRTSMQRQPPDEVARELLAALLPR